MLIGGGLSDISYQRSGNDPWQDATTQKGCSRRNSRTGEILRAADGAALRMTILWWSRRA